MGERHSYSISNHANSDFEIRRAFAPHGLRLASRRDGDGWSAILLER